MKKLTVTLALAALAFGTLPGLSGCEERVAYEKSVDVEDDKVKSKETTVTETPEGNIRVEEKRTTEEYDDGQLKKETETETRTVPR